MCVRGHWSWVKVLAVAVMLAGCQAPPQPAGPTVERIATSSGEENDLLWEAITRTLREYDFRIDRQDRVNGVISTHPETTAQGFELWRRQPGSAYDWWEANLATTRRQAVVQIRPADRPGEFDLEVTVRKERYSLEERQVDNAAAALRLYSSDAPTVSGRSPRLRESQAWIPQGRDAILERVILRRILQHCGRSAGPDTQPAI